jgi:pimeloyl-ACP methyl ester carboxylesterase
MDLGAMAGRLEALRALVPDVTCPTLVLRGGESDVFLDEDAERFANALPDGRWVRIAGAGHTIQGDQPAALVHAIREFLAEALPGRERSL